MYLFPNGQNIQFLPSPLPRKAPTSETLVIHDPPKKEAAQAAGVLQALKDLAPHLNRKERRRKLAELRSRAKQEAVAAAKKEMKKQQKESSRD